MISFVSVSKAADYELVNQGSIPGRVKCPEWHSLHNSNINIRNFCPLN